MVHELRRRLRGEAIMYLADLLLFPYGPRPQPEVRSRALDVIGHLTAAGTKLVVIACNTATAAALNTARERFDVPIVGVIAPGAQAAAAATVSGRVAVVSTEGTRASNEYVHALKEANPGIAVLGLAAPQLVDIVEAGDADSSRAESALQPVVDQTLAFHADTLVLGCTHYPLLMPALTRVVGSRPLQIVDSAATTAERVSRILAVNRLGAARDADGTLELQVTALPERFSESVSRLFGEQLDMPRTVRIDTPLVAA